MDRSNGMPASCGHPTVMAVQAEKVNRKLHLSRCLCGFQGTWEQCKLLLIYQYKKAAISRVCSEIFQSFFQARQTALNTFTDAILADTLLSGNL